METEEIQNDGDDFKILRGKKGNSKECEKHQNKIISSLPSELSPVLLPNIHQAIHLVKSSARVKSTIVAREQQNSGL